MNQENSSHQVVSVSLQNPHLKQLWHMLDVLGFTEKTVSPERIAAIGLFNGFNFSVKYPEQELSPELSALFQLEKAKEHVSRLQESAKDFPRNAHNNPMQRLWQMLSSCVTEELNILATKDLPSYLACYIGLGLALGRKEGKLSNEISLVDKYW